MQCQNSRWESAKRRGIGRRMGLLADSSGRSAIFQHFRNKIFNNSSRRPLSAPTFKLPRGGKKYEGKGDPQVRFHSEKTYLTISIIMQYKNTCPQKQMILY